VNNVAVACARFLYLAGTNNSSQGSVFAFGIDPRSGALTAVPESPFASFYTASDAVVDPSGRFLYLADGGVSGYAINGVSGALTPTPNSPYIAGDTPIALRVSPSGKFLYVANHYGYDISIFTIDSTTGALTLSSTVSLGSTLEPWDLEINDAGTFLYVTSEDYSQAFNGILKSYLGMYAIDSNTGDLSPIKGSPLTFSQVGIANLAIRPTSSVLYVYVGGNILAYNVNSSTGTLTPLAASPVLTNVTFEPFTFTPDGALALAATVDFNTSARTIAVYRIDPNSGAWNQVPNSPFAAGAGADSIVVEPTGRFVYLVGASGIDVYTLANSTGSLTPIAGFQFTFNGNSGAFTTN
jgi:6-phosphogluconolactonase (cycloisomerase 2 family)